MKILTWMVKLPFLFAALFVLATELPSNAQNMTPDQQRAQQAARELDEKAKRLEMENHPAEAVPVRRQVIAILRQAFGDGSPEADGARQAVSETLMALGRYVEARQLIQKCLDTRRAALGVENHLVADALNRIGETYRREGDLTNAMANYQMAESTLAKLPPSSALLANVLNNEALVFSARGDFAKAETQWARVVALKEQAGQRDDALAAALTSLGESHRALGRSLQAEAEHHRALSILSNHPPHHPYRLAAENNLASVYRDQGRTREATAIYRRTIELMSTQVGPDDLDVLVIRRNLAMALSREHDHAGALEIIDDGLTRLESSRRTAHPLFFTLQTDKTDRLIDLGDAGRARKLLESILGERSRSEAANHPVLWAVRERLALCALAQGDLSVARKLLDEVLVYRRTIAPNSPRNQEHLASTLIEWSRFARTLGRSDEAELALKEVQQIVRQHLGPANPLIGELWSEAGFLAERQGRLEAALSSHRTARDFFLRTQGERSAAAAGRRINVADLLARLGQTVVALDEVIGAHGVLVNLLTGDSPLVVAAEFNLANHMHRAGRLDDAARHYEAVLEVMERQRWRHLPAVARDLAFLELERGQPQLAAQHAKRASSRQEELWREVVRFASQDDRLAWQGTYDVYSALASVAEHHPEPLAQAVLRFKGAVLDSLIEDAQLLARRSDPTAAGDLVALQKARGERYHLELLTQSRRPPSADQVHAARERVEQLESRLAQRGGALEETRRTRTISVQAVQNSLRADEALVEFVRFERWLGRGRTEPHYGVLILTNSGAPRWIVLGSARPGAEIASAITNWQEIIHERPGMNVLAPLQILHDRIWSKIEPAVKTARKIIIAPDGDLNFVSFAALWCDDHFLGEHFAFRYVTSGRDLLASDYQAPRHKAVCIVAAPQYARSGWQRQVTGPIQSAWTALCNVLAFRGASLEDLLASYRELPGTEREAKAVAKLARENGCQPVKLWQGEDATEKILRESSSPYLLHMATHGVFLPDPVITNAQAIVVRRQVVPRQPMHRSWIMLARANETLDAWRHGDVPDPLNDGLLTAEEASLLPLGNTWLVTLSACDTGLGVGRSGEGVMGLRRGLALAGARHILMTLWPIHDDYTCSFMEAFYAAAIPTNDAVGALGSVQQHLLREWRKNKSPAQAARFFGGFVISSRGR